MGHGPTATDTPFARDQGQDVPRTPKPLKHYERRRRRAVVHAFEEASLNTPQAVGATGSTPRSPLPLHLEDDELCTPIAEPTLDGNNVQGSPSRSHSLSGCLKRFAQKVLKKAATPLLQTKIYDSPSLPW